MLSGLGIGDSAAWRRDHRAASNGSRLRHRHGGYFSVKDAKPLTCPDPGRDEKIQHETVEITSSIVSESLAP